MNTTTTAERFAMCMAEAGYPLEITRPWEPAWKPHPAESTPAFWRAAYRAQLLAVPDDIIQSKWCEEHFATERARRGLKTGEVCECHA